MAKTQSEKIAAVEREYGIAVPAALRDYCYSIIRCEDEASLDWIIADLQAAGDAKVAVKTFLGGKHKALVIRSKLADAEG
jgi:hypothetical protein